MKFLLATVLTLFTLNLSAMTIKSIKYDGMVHISESVALRMLPFEVGDDVNEEVINKAIKKYFKQNYFSDIWVENIEGDITFYFKEKPIISKVELKGWKENDKEIKDSVIQIKKGSLYNEKKLEAAKKRIVTAISQDGKIDSVVEIEKEYLENGSIKITFIVNEGEEIVIEKLVFSGVSGLNPELFNEVIANKEHQFIGWFWGRNDGKMSLTDLEYDPLRIRDMYMQHGYLDAKVEEPFVRVNFDHYTADMSYQIEEGDVYKISEVIIHQVKNVIDEAKIRDVISLIENEVFNIETFRNDAQKLKTIIADLGYAFTQVTPDLQKNKEDNTVKVIFKIVPGEKVKIRNVVIAGNTRTLDRIIRRELYLGPGDMYSLTDLTDSRNALGRLGFFEGNTIEEKRIDNQTMDLVVKVKEAPTGNIQLGGGYGSYGGLLVSVAVDDRNVWGSGINVGIKAERSEMTENASFNISNPRLNDSDFSGNFAISESMYEYNDYTVHSESVSIGSGHRFSRHVSGYIGYSYSSNSYDMDDIDEESLGSYDYYFEDYSKSSISMSVSLDNTDDYYLPREGFTMSQSFEKSGLGADASFFKSRTKYAKYYGLDDYVGFDLIFRYKARLNLVADTGYLPIAERYYMGGLGSVRGYESYSLSPTVTETSSTGIETTRRVGGKKTFSNNLELSFPLIPKAKMRMVAFLDYGMIGDDKIDQISRGGYGVGIEWFSPVGPIQLMFANPLLEEDLDKTAHFEFTMGQRF
ncbi:MAG: outer membrane protein assembly factor BamA [Campylobacterota bacterium]|nr:outer membrane protein assembly factor BamA [Campylobacterota bacterium]